MTRAMLPDDVKGLHHEREDDKEVQHHERPECYRLPFPKSVAAIGINSAGAETSRDIVGEASCDQQRRDKDHQIGRSVRENISDHRTGWCHKHRPFASAAQIKLPLAIRAVTFGVAFLGGYDAAVSCSGAPVVGSGM